MRHRQVRMALAVTGALACMNAAAAVTFYQGEGFRGPSMTVDRPEGNLERQGFNDRASSVIVDRGRWEVCEDAGFNGKCVVLRRGNYESLRSMGLNNRISSVRPVGQHVRTEYEVAPSAAPLYEYRTRPGERTYQAQVTSVRAVVGTPEQRCWVEKEQVGGRSDPNIGGAVVGGILGGVLGHQVGSGRGNDAATALGAVAGAAVGANTGRSGGYTRDVQRCENVASGPPAYWDVTYNFRGADHQVQMASQPGPTILVNERGEPRG